MSRRLILLGLLLPVVLLSQSCAGGAGGGSGSVRYSLEGPPLVIAGEQATSRFSGQMERACMIGQGQMTFQAADLVCAGEIKSAPNKAGHIAAMIGCADGKALLLTFRALGPDQGIGLGRFFEKNGPTNEEPLIFYFHPCEEEAERRLEQEKSTLLGIISKKEKS